MSFGRGAFVGVCACAGQRHFVPSPGLQWPTQAHQIPSLHPAADPNARNQLCWPLLEWREEALSLRCRPARSAALHCSERVPTAGEPLALTGSGLAVQPPGSGYVAGRGPGLCQPSIWIGSASGSYI